MKASRRLQLPLLELFPFSIHALSPFSNFRSGQFLSLYLLTSILMQATVLQSNASQVDRCGNFLPLPSLSVQRPQNYKS